MSSPAFKAVVFICQVFNSQHYEIVESFPLPFRSFWSRFLASFATLELQNFLWRKLAVCLSPYASIFANLVLCDS